MSKVRFSRVKVFFLFNCQWILAKKLTSPTAVRFPKLCSREDCHWKYLSRLGVRCFWPIPLHNTQCWATAVETGMTALNFFFLKTSLSSLSPSKVKGWIGSFCLYFISELFSLIWVQSAFSYLPMQLNILLTKQKSARRFSSKQTLPTASYTDKATALLSFSWPTDNFRWTHSEEQCFF